MQNARQRMGRLEYFKAPANAKSTSTHITLWMDRAIIQPGARNESGVCHLLSVFGGEQEISAISAAMSEEARFTVSGPELASCTVSLREKTTVFRSSIALAGRKHPVKHLVALSEEMVQTQAGRNPGASQTVLYDDDAQFVAYRLGVRFGIPMMPEWSPWISDELRRRNLLDPLPGVGCSPVFVKAGKKLLLAMIGHGLTTRRITIPEDAGVIRWKVLRSIGA